MSVFVSWPGIFRDVNHPLKRHLSISSHTVQSWSRPSVLLSCFAHPTSTALGICRMLIRPCCNGGSLYYQPFLRTNTYELCRRRP